MAQADARRPTATARSKRRLIRSRSDLLPVGSLVLVAYSGGPDSTALLHQLVEARQMDSGLRVEAAHFDHGLRPESAAVAERCARHCTGLAVPFHSGAPASPLPARHSALRRARYEFLARTARSIGADCIATAHHADDQAETVLLRIDRGTGVRGLAGIPRRRGEIVRPLLDTRRAEILGWLAERAIEFESDPANEDLRWARARVRHLLLPALRQALGRDPVPLLVELAERAGEAERWLALSGAALLARAVRGDGRADPARDRNHPEKHSLFEWRSASDLERAEALRVWARSRGLSLSRGGTRAATEFITRGRSGGSIVPARGLRISRSFDSLVFETPAPDSAGFGSRRSCLELHQGGGQARTELGGRSFEVRWAAAAEPERGCEPVQPRDGRHPAGPAVERVALAVGPEHYPLVLRTRNPGDRIVTPGGTRKLKKLFGELKVPNADRDRIPVLVDRTGRVVWVSGMTIAAWARPPAGRADLVIEIENA